MSNEIQKIDSASPALVTAGFGNSLAFEFMQRQAMSLAKSELVPEQFSIVPGKGKPQLTNDEKATKIANVVIALEMANRVGASPLSVMQNLYIVQGKPGWSSQFIIAAINSTGQFSPIRFSISEAEPEKEVSYEVTEWKNGQKTVKKVSEKICNKTCVAWAIERETGERLESPPISYEMAVKEGWWSKAGSKWQTMPELMLRYRAATLFGRLYAPQVLMGMKSSEEIEDIQDATIIEGTTVIPASKASVLEGFGTAESILPEKKEPAPAAEKTETKEKTTRQATAAAAEVAKEETAAPEPAPSAPAADPAEEVIPADKLTFMYLDELSGLTGDSQDDLIDEYSKHKFGCLADLMGALNDKTKLTMAYLSNVLVPALKAKAVELQQEV